MSDWKNILPGKEGHAKDDELIKYLEGKLSDEDKNAFEQKTADSDFVNDAIEGLSHFDSKQRLKEHVEQLNKTLHTHLVQRKKRRNKLKLKENPWILVGVLLILAFAIIAYVVIRMNNANT